MAAGTGGLLGLVLIALRFYSPQGPMQQMAFKARRVERVAHMRYSLAAAAAAEKSAVLAASEPGALDFADQARSASAEVEVARRELGTLLEAGGTAKERELLANFSSCFGDLQRIDHDLLELAVQNTNVKATRLAFGPAAEAVGAMDAALSHLFAARPTAPRDVLLLAAGARAAAWRLQAQLAPHIAEPSDQRMDEMEAQMARDHGEIRRALAVLAARPELAADPDLATARAAYARFGELRSQILVLSRENTNVRSLAISLDQKRKVTAVCEDALYALQQEIEEEPTAGVPPNPRQLIGEPPPEP